MVELLPFQIGLITSTTLFAGEAPQFFYLPSGHLLLVKGHAAAAFIVCCAAFIMYDVRLLPHPCMYRGGASN